METSIPKNFKGTNIPFSAVRALTSETVGYYINKFQMKELWKHTKGEGVTFAILDTGAPVHYDSIVHEQFNFTTEDGFEDGNGHGSHVLGIMGAQHNIIGIRGLSPDSNAITCKVLGSNGNGNGSWTDGGLEMILQRNDVDVVNMSLGGSQISSHTRTLLKKLHEKGVAVFVAAGNWGESASNAYATEHTFSVAAVNAQDKPANFSSVSDENDASSYGVDILSFGTGQSLMKASGTSMACPTVAGIACLLISAAKKTGRKLKPDELFDILRSTARDIGQPGNDSKTGAGIIQPLEALKKVIPIEEPSAPEEPEPSSSQKWVMWTVVGVIITVLALAYFLS